MLPPNYKVVAIGGGHGLSQVLKAFSYLESNLTAIVTTSDNGGSSGRLRKVNKNIAWGDIRHCLTSLINDELACEILNFRFKGNLELGGHNLGNIIFTALEQMGKTPLDAIDYIKQLLNIKTHIFPMSETPVDLQANLVDGSVVLGETQIDNLKSAPNSIQLQPQVDGIDNAVTAIKDADLIILGPGSFYTSVLPPLLISTYAKAIANSTAKVTFVDNISNENSPADYLTLKQKLQELENILGKQVDTIIANDATQQFDDRVMVMPEDACSNNVHCKITLSEMIAESVIHKQPLASAS